MALLDDLKWRYATKSYDKTKSVAPEDLQTILEAARLAPSSSGLQPFKILVISNQELKEKIVPIAWGQQIVADSAYLLVFTAWDSYTAERIDNVYDQIVAERNLPESALSDYVNKLKTTYLAQTADENFAHTARQVYIALTAAMLQAAELKIDSTPMEGFTNTELDALLNLEAAGLKSVVMLPIGYRDSNNDWLEKMKKVRKSTEGLLQFID